MSLVSEALRKARQEAAAREGRERGIPRGLAVPPKRWRSGPGLALAILIALAAAIAGAGIAWWAVSRRPAATTAGLEVSRSAPPPVAPAATVPTATPAETTQGTQPSREAPTREVHAASDQGRAAVAVAGPRPETAAAAAATGAASGAAPGGALGASGTATESPGPHGEHAEGGRGERTFLIDADLGYAKLHLDYVVYRPGSPFAGINGQQVIIGSVIEGFQVEEIGPDLVRLHDRRGVVVLRTH